MPAHGSGKRRGKARASTGRAQRTGSGFDFTTHVRRVVEDMVERLPQLDHIDPSLIAIAFCQARKRVDHGLYASLTPMRFEGGSLTTVKRKRTYTVQRLYGDDGREMLYILSFYLPRFLDTTFQEKLVTILHELWHISPNFDGDMRRHEGRCYMHTHSQAEYDSYMGELADQWLAQNPPEKLFGWLRCSFSELFQRHGGMYGVRIPQPKLIPVAKAG